MVHRDAHPARVTLRQGTADSAAFPPIIKREGDWGKELLGLPGSSREGSGGLQSANRMLLQFEGWGSAAQISSIVWPYFAFSRMCFKPCKPNTTYRFPVKYQAGSSELIGMHWKSQAKGIPGKSLASV